ncbi:MAG: L-seryl-tRNA(Sec) selenium transferase [Phycisphaerales bacterium]|jgi:L-seryl-tRNA(Ser) seleniumtransferase|nr:L-seryl-tRNA(Sec) selenium transferase [Phycisphaerales bacterium]MBT7171434.1 L-seryl-tRNA(Sec) selenium transferase [Phycisphaerales bacterium]
MSNSLRLLPSVDAVLAAPALADTRACAGHDDLVALIRAAIDEMRANLLDESFTPPGVDGDVEAGLLAWVVDATQAMFAQRAEPNINRAINATGIIMHTALGRSVYAPAVVESISSALDGYVTLAVDCETGKRSERSLRVEDLLCEITGAEAALVVNNNAGATMLALMALAGGGEGIVSRGQLIEIGGSFRLPEVMELSGVTLREIGATNRVHLRDYQNAITEDTTAIIRAHPSNYRVVGFHKEVSLDDLVTLAHDNDLLVLDDLGAGALVDLADFGIPHEPTVQHSLATGADVVMVSTDKLIGAGQGGLLLGSKDAIARCRKHPLYRVLRVDKTCLMVLERTLHLFRNPEALAKTHPLYRMISLTMAELRETADAFSKLVAPLLAGWTLETVESENFLGSGTMPMEAMKGIAVAATPPAGLSADDVARGLRLDSEHVFTRLHDGSIYFEMRCVTEPDLSRIAEALARVLSGGAQA